MRLIIERRENVRDIGFATGNFYSGKGNESERLDSGGTHEAFFNRQRWRLWVEFPSGVVFLYTFVASCSFWKLLLMKIWLTLFVLIHILLYYRCTCGQPARPLSQFSRKQGGTTLASNHSFGKPRRMEASCIRAVGGELVTWPWKSTRRETSR